MRLSVAEGREILSAVRMLDADCRVFLYGSRVDPKLAGGDIDLLVISERIGFSERVSLLVEIKKRIGEQKIDLLVKTAKEAAENTFIQTIKKSAVELT